MPGGGNMMGYSGGGGGGGGGGGSGGKSTTSDIENMEWNIGTAQLPHVVRYGSGSSQTSQSSGDICRICHCESDLHNPLLTPCYCSGSLKYVHQTCLQQWLTASETNSCELCKFPFIMHTKIKPFNEWESLEMSGVERRRLCCAVLFHCAAAICVIWSLCVLIERAAEEVKRGQIGWPFWTKLVVVTVGLTGGMVFMVIQCRQYFHLCQRWRARNRILLIQNAPEKMHPISPPSPVLVSRHQQQPYQQHHHQHHLPRSSSGSNSHGGGGGSSSGGGGGGGGIGIGGVGAMHMPAGGFVCGGNSNADACSSHAHCPSMSSGGGMSSSTHQHHIYQQQQQHQQHSMASTSGGAGGSGGRPSHGQIIANIENNPLHYERDWQLDDSSQSSFRPCPQGSGSMTPMPFHDSVHNMYETVSVTTTTTASNQPHQQQTAGGPAGPRRSASNSTTGSLVFDPLTQTVAVQPEPQSAQLQHYQQTHRANIKQQLQQQQPQPQKTPELALFKNATALPPASSSSAVFLENSDILNDAQYPKLYHRHSAAFAADQPAGQQPIAAMQSPQSSHPAAATQLMDTRRFSDSRLLQHGSGQEPAIFNVTSVLGVAIPHHPDDGAGANVTEIVFGESAGAGAVANSSHSGPYDALELNIQEMLELDGGRMAAHRRCGGQGGDGRKARHSLHNVSTTLDGALQMLAGSGGDGLMGASVGSDSIGGGGRAGVGGAAAGLRQNRIGVSTFKSLPNLSASSENLLQQHK